MSNRDGVSSEGQSQHDQGPLSAEELGWLSAVTNGIIPRTETPGASDAGVPAFINEVMAAGVRQAKWVQLFRDARRTLDRMSIRQFGVSFERVSLDAQAAILDEGSRNSGSREAVFVEIVKSLTIDGYYTSEVGLTRELGWNPEESHGAFRPCSHPEHLD